MDELALRKLLQADIESKSNRYVARDYFYKKGPFNSKHFASNKNLFVYTNYFKVLVNQKIDYLLIKDPTIREKSIDVVMLSDLLEDVVLNASLDGIGWLFFYVDKNVLRWYLVPDREIIPIYDKYNKELVEVIRYYTINDDMESFQVEYWTLDGVTLYTVNKNTLHVELEKSHCTTAIVYPDEIADEINMNFKMLPFIPLYNNKAKFSDLEGLQDLFDLYDSLITGYTNNIKQFQEAILKLVGFTGDKKELRKVLCDIEENKVLSMPDRESDADYIKIDIPVEARRVLLDITKDNIILLGQGVDPHKVGEGNLTDTILKARYSGLDMKGSRTEKQLKIFYKKFVNFIGVYDNQSLNDYLSCNRNMLFNISESLKNCKEALSFLSLETVLENCPWVSDPEKEIKRLEKEAELKSKVDVNDFSNNSNNDSNNDSKTDSGELNNTSGDVSSED